MSQTTEFIDLSDHDAFVDAVPHETFAALRATTPCTGTPSPTAEGSGR